MRLQAVIKFIVAVVGAALLAVQVGLSDGGFSNNDWVSVGIAVVTALGVYAIPNRTTVEPTE